MKKLVILFLLSITFTSNAQIVWQKCLGGSGDERAFSMMPTALGGYIIAGSTTSNDGDVMQNNGLRDWWVINIDYDGYVVWEKTIGGTKDEGAYSILQADDGGYVVTGISSSDDGDFGYNEAFEDIWVVKLDSAGTIVWTRRLGGWDSDIAYSVNKTHDGGYIIAGTTDSHGGGGSIQSLQGADDYVIVKLRANGTIQWTRIYGGTADDHATSVEPTADGGYIVAGRSRSGDGDVAGNFSIGYYDCWILKLDDAGAIQWQKTFGGSYDDMGVIIRQTNDGGYILGCSSDSGDGDVSGHHGISGQFYHDYWVLKLDSLGSIQWEKSLGGTEVELISSIGETTDGGYIISGSSSSNDGDVSEHYGDTGGFNFDYWIVKLDSLGSIQWEQSLGGTDEDWNESILQTINGTYITVGYSYSQDGDVVGNRGNDIWVLEFEEQTSGIEKNNFNQTNIFPNPVSNKLNIETTTENNSYVQYQIINTLGATAMANKATAKDFSIDVSTLPSGIYFIHLQNGTAKTVKRFVKE